MSRSSNIKRQFRGLTEEQVREKAKELALKEEMAYWRRKCLKKYRQSSLMGNFEPSGVV